MPIRLTELLQQVPRETESRVRKTREATRNIIQEQLRSECRLQLKVSADILWTAIEAKHKDMVAARKEFLDPNLIPSINAVRSHVLNRLSHDGGLGLTDTDVQTAIKTMKAFRASTIPHRP